MQQYSPFFQTLHDEIAPTGYLGRGTHYSVLRAVIFHDPLGKPLSSGQFADFAVIWDEDHDVRVIEPIQEIYRRGLLSSFLMFGERKGTFSAVLSTEISSKLEGVAFNPAFLLKVIALELSVRAATCLSNYNIIYIGDLIQMTEAEMLRIPNMGRKSLNEIKEVLAQMGLLLGTYLPGWPPGNVKNQAATVAQISHLESEVGDICQSLSDSWPSNVVHLASGNNPIIQDEGERVALYLNNLRMLWQLGIGGRAQPRAHASPPTDLHQRGNPEFADNPSPAPSAGWIIDLADEAGSSS